MKHHVDITQTTTHVSLCAGYGGIDLGLRRAIPTLRTVAFSEIEGFAAANLVAKMESGLLDAAPIWTDVKTFPWEAFRDRVDILSGGYPCQPFSAAGKRLGRDDPRHLWPWIADGIRAMRPRICFFENVEGHISLGLREVISEMEILGYATTWGIFSAREVGAPHQRKRVFILAYRNSERLERYNGLQSGCSEPRWESSESEGSPCWCNSSRNTWPSRPGEPQHGWEPPRVVTGRETLDDSESGDLRLNRNDQRTTDRESNAAYITSNGGGEGEAASMGNAKHDGSHQCDSEARGEIIGSEQGRMQELEGGSSSVGNSSDWSNGQQPTEQQGRNTSGRSSEESGAMGNCNRIDWRTSAEGWEHNSEAGSASERQTQPSMGRDSDGSSNRMDDAELFITCDNRTDELRLLGNGVVPATAERAFIILSQQLNHNQ